VICRDCGRDFETLTRDLHRLDVFRALGDETPLCVACLPAYLEAADAMSVEDLIKRLRGMT
jgi:hypothetical protein